jgi:hypothetical protein
MQAQNGGMENDAANTEVGEESREISSLRQLDHDGFAKGQGRIEPVPYTQPCRGRDRKASRERGK